MSEQLVGSWDADAQRFIATGWIYGPAGPASVDVSPTVRLSVDYANPEMTSEITIDARKDGAEGIDADTERVARALLGPEVLSRLLDLAGRQGPGHPVLISDQAYSGDPRQDDRRQALGRFALLVETATDADASTTKRALAAVEAAAIADLDVLLPVAQRLARTGVEGLLTLGPDELQMTRELSAAIDSAARLVDDKMLVERLRRRTRDWEPRTPRIAAAAAATPPPSAKRAKVADMPMDMAMEAAPAEQLAGRIGPSIETDGTSTAHQVHPTEIEVRARDAGDDHWARVFRRTDRLLLALAPLRESRALLVIPTGFAASDLVVDITDDPAAARPSPELLLVRAAVAAGREACRLERLGYGDPSEHWMECAESWEEAGSRERAETAREYAFGERGRRGQRRQRGRTTAQAPFLSDRV